MRQVNKLIRGRTFNVLQTLTEHILLILGLRLFGSRRNVISNDSKNLFIPFSNDCGLHEKCNDNYSKQLLLIITCHLYMLKVVLAFQL